MTTSPAPDASRAAPDRRVLSARGPEDLLAAVPVVLGFQPQESVVMLTFGGPHAFHARIDLPEVEGLAAMTDLLLEPALRHEVHGVAFVVYTDDELRARQASRVLEQQFGGGGLDVQVVLRADGERWWLLSGDGPHGSHGSQGAPGVPYDLSLHPFRLQSVVDGQVTHGSREELAATLATDVGAAALVGAALPGARAFDVLDVAACTAHHVGHRTCLSNEELAGLAVSIGAADVRDGAWAAMSRATAREHVRLWTDAVRRTPPDLLGGPAAVLSFAAWLAGDGALAWCAVDRAVTADPDNSLARLVGDLLGGAVPPDSWEVDGS
jgi:hypothetical protein